MLKTRTAEHSLLLCCYQQHCCVSAQHAAALLCALAAALLTWRETLWGVEGTCTVCEPTAATPEPGMMSIFTCRQYSPYSARRQTNKKQSNGAGQQGGHVVGADSMRRALRTAA